MTLLLPKALLPLTHRRLQLAVWTANPLLRGTTERAVVAWCPLLFRQQARSVTSYQLLERLNAVANVTQEVVEGTRRFGNEVQENRTVVVPEFVPVLVLVPVAASLGRCTTRAVGWAIWVVVAIVVGEGIQGASEAKGDLEDLALERPGLGVESSLPHRIRLQFLDISRHGIEAILGVEIVGVLVKQVREIVT
jgi:hypothetical protein